MTEPFSIAVNGSQYQFSSTPESAHELDMIPVGDGSFHLLRNGQSYHATLESADYKARLFTFRINGTLHSVKITDQYERLVHQMGLSTGSNKQINHLKAPMPGLVIQILALPGQEVQKGDPLLILEAMKMENVIKAVGTTKIKSVHITKGAAVEKGQLLLEFE